MRKMRLLSCLLTLAFAGSVQAANVLLNTSPFAGSTALETPGRQVTGANELFLAGFDVNSDVFAFDRAAFPAVTEPLSFRNDFSVSFVGGLNVIVLRDTDNDANPATAFNAGTAANLIAAALPDVPTPGFFIYSNSGLGVNRLVYSTDLTVNTADLSILVRITSPTGVDAVNALPTFAERNFAVVPEPATLAGLLAGSLLALRRR